MDIVGRLLEDRGALGIPPDRFTTDDLVRAVDRVLEGLGGTYAAMDQELVADWIGFELLILREAYWMVEPAGETVH